MAAGQLCIYLFFLSKNANNKFQILLGDRMSSMDLRKQD